MKILVTYLSQTGNTKKIAHGILEAVSEGNEATIKRLEDVTPSLLNENDLIFVGSPLHAGSLTQPTQEFLKTLTKGASKRLAGFITHFAPAYPDQSMDKFKEPLLASCEANGIKYEGCFSCQGALIESLHAAVQKKLNLTDDQWAETVKQMTGHPNEEDVANAKAFAKNVLSGIK